MKDFLIGMLLALAMMAAARSETMFWRGRLVDDLMWSLVCIGACVLAVTAIR